MDLHFAGVVKAERPGQSGDRRHAHPGSLGHRSDRRGGHKMQICKNGLHQLNFGAMALVDPRLQADDDVDLGCYAVALASRRRVHWAVVPVLGRRCPVAASNRWI